MAPGRDNGDRSALAMFAAELRAARTRAGLSRDELAARINYSGSLVGLVENMIRVPTLPFAQRLDEVLQTPGTFGRMQEHLRATPFPAWFHDWLDAEREATSLRTWEPLLVPGLLQTADYARAILAAGPEAVADEVERMVSARMDRQASGPQPPDGQLNHADVSSTVTGGLRHRTMIQSRAPLTDDTLDRIDEIVPPGTDVGRLDQAYQPPALEDPSLRRRPLSARAAA